MCCTGKCFWKNINGICDIKESHCPVETEKKLANVEVN